MSGIERRFALALAMAALVAGVSVRAQQSSAGGRDTRFEVSAAAGLIAAPANGRLFVVLAKKADPEPVDSIGDTGIDANPVAAIDVTRFDGRQPAIIDRTAVAFPIESLSAVPAGDYVAQAVLDTNADLKAVDAPGNLLSEPTPITIGASGSVIRLQLTRKAAAEELPPPTEELRWVKLESRLLSAFHKRPIYLRAGVVLPRGYERDTARRYPLRVRIGGYGASYTTIQRMMRDEAPFRKAWMSDEAPRMILVHLDGDGPLGDPYQVNSANHGPYGDAVTQELIPYLERQFRIVAEPRARVLDGGSTGGWVSLALQIFYPDLFNGTWSYCPDGVDFRGFQLVNIYEDTSAYVNKGGFDRPSAREINGDVRFTMRHELQMERVLGAGDAWTMSGGQWGAWNATYGPRGADGRPVPLWDGKTGAIDRTVAEQWRKYDLRLLLETNWTALAPKLQGKISVWMGDADNYFLNNAARMLEAFFQKAQPPYQGRMFFAPMQGHCWIGLSDLEIMKEMGARTGAMP
jgi:hypothetical protein